MSPPVSMDGEPPFMSVFTGLPKFEAFFRRRKQESSRKIDITRIEIGVCRLQNGRQILLVHLTFLEFHHFVVTYLKG